MKWDIWRKTLAVTQNFPLYSLHRSVIIGPQLDIKICTLGTVINRLAYPADYCHLEGGGWQSQPMPIRWMAWESVLIVSRTHFSWCPVLTGLCCPPEKRTTAHDRNADECAQNFINDDKIMGFSVFCYSVPENLIVFLLSLIMFELNKKKIPFHFAPNRPLPGNFGV